MQNAPTPVAEAMTAPLEGTPDAALGTTLDAPDRCYVYYRVDEADLPAVVPLVRAMQQRLQALHPGLACGLLRRPELRDGQVTVMETYGGAAPLVLGPAFAQALAQASTGLPQPRHTEWFEPL